MNICVSPWVIIQCYHCSNGSSYSPGTPLGCLLCSQSMLGPLAGSTFYTYSGRAGSPCPEPEVSCTWFLSLILNITWKPRSRHAPCFGSVPASRSPA